MKKDGLRFLAARRWPCKFPSLMADHLFSTSFYKFGTRTKRIYFIILFTRIRERFFFLFCFVFHPEGKCIVYYCKPFWWKKRKIKKKKKSRRNISSWSLIICEKYTSTAYSKCVCISAARGIHWWVRASRTTEKIAYVFLIFFFFYHVAWRLFLTKILLVLRNSVL